MFSVLTRLERFVRSWASKSWKGNLCRTSRRAGLSVEWLEDRVVPASVIYRVNAGGPELAGNPLWSADTAAAPSTFANAVASGSQTFSTGNTIDLTHASVPAGTPMELFQTERWDPPEGEEMQWNFAVTAGNYEVRLYFADIYSGTQAVGARVFDVSIEGVVVLNDYDIFADVGGFKGVVKTFQVASDTNLDIDFAHVTENPALKAIEILDATSSGGTGTPPVTTIGFAKSTLSGASLSSPTSLQFGPDGRLYVAQQDGIIKVFTLVRNGANSYAVTATETITLINTLPNRNDDGVLNPSVTGRLVTGLLVTGTTANPVIYVASSDPRIGAGPDGTDLNLDTNSGILSRLTWNGSQWVKLDLVRGLPRSEENHTSNGLQLDPTTNKLYLAQGGNTNMGAPSNNFANLPEYALSAAILSIDLNAIGNTTYDIPTLNDETRSGNADANDPFGGNDGKNQAMLVPGGPVQVYSPGYRNPYDVVLTQSGKLYSIDNGANAGWGDTPVFVNGEATNQVHEPGITEPDNLHLVTAGFYAGHANPTRANTANTFNSSNPQSPVSQENPVEGTYIPVGSDGSLTTFTASTNGLVEYTASNFAGALKGDLLAASFSNQIFRIKLNAAGTSVVLKEGIFNSVGALPLDVTAVGDAGLFPGTIWVCDYVNNSLVVFEPNDFGGGGAGGTGADDPGLDEDGDGYDNHDEIVNGTNPLSAGDVPPDWDADFNSNKLDPDDDNDGLPDTSDPFAIDRLNGKGTPLPVLYTWENEGGGPGGLLGLGFTGLMTNGVANYESLFDTTKLTAGGAAGVLTLDAVSEGDATNNNQTQAFQFGVDVTPATGSFTVHTRVVAPFAGLTPQAGQSLGLFLGAGDQNNYAKIVLDGAGQIKLVSEVNGSVSNGPAANVTLTGMQTLDLYLTLDPLSGKLQAKFSILSGGVQGPITNLGSPITLPTSWWRGSTGLAVGIISSSAGPAPEFPATWDFLEVLPETKNTLVVTPSSLTYGNTVVGTTATQALTLKNNGNAGDPAITINSTTIGGAAAGFFGDSFNDAASVTLAPGQSTTINVSYSPSAAGTHTAILSINHSGSNAPVQIALAGAGEAASTGKALVVIDTGGGINGSTFNSDSFRITNQSTGGVKISKVRFDFSTALLPDLVLDPNGGAGDTVSKNFTPDSSSAVGLTGNVFLNPHDDGFDAIEVSFNDFNPGEHFNFSVDADPTTIRGSGAPGPNESGSVSGLELVGSRTTVTFSDGTTKVVDLYRMPSSLSGSQGVAATGALARPDIQLLGAASPAALNNANQTVRVIGPAGATVQLLIAEAGLFTSGLPGGGFDLDPFEANSIIGVTEKTAVIGASGFVDIAVTLTNSQSNAGNNRIVAVLKDATGRTGPVSNLLVAQFSPTPQAPPPSQNHAPVANAGADQTVTLPNSAALQGAATDDALPAGSTLTTTWTKVSGPGTVTFTNATSLATNASFSVAGTYVLRLTASDGQLAHSDDVTIVVNGAAGTVAVKNLALINAVTDLPIDAFSPLLDGAILNLATLPTTKLNIKANLNGLAAGSVQFVLDGQVFRTENGAPYALAGDNLGDFANWTPDLGTHTLTATPYNKANAQGAAGTPLTITFTVINDAAPPPPPTSTVVVQSFTLINANTDLPIDAFKPLVNGATLNLATLPTNKLNIKAVLNTTISGSVQFVLDGQLFRTENSAPYALAGDANGDFHAWTPSVGTHTLTATPYNKPNAQGAAGTSLTITFNVVNNPSAASLTIANFKGESISNFGKGTDAKPQLRKVPGQRTAVKNTSVLGVKDTDNLDKFFAAVAREKIPLHLSKAVDADIFELRREI